MGSYSSRQAGGVEELDIGVNHAYKYPPKSGNYFSSHFIMGGERFETAQPESYLFGENMDLNFLGSRPSPFPYPAPNANDPSKALRALINIRKESLRFVRVVDEGEAQKTSSDRGTSSLFNIEFTFDCDVRCSITIMYFCTEEITTSGIVYTPYDPSMNSETFLYKRGSNQQFSQTSHIFDPSLYPEENLSYSFEREVIPIVIYCVAEEGDEPRQAHATVAVVEKHSDGYAIKPLKQKLFADGLSYLLQEIYGIENKNTDSSKLNNEEETDDNGAECVICMCDLRDTLILPCRHLCLCNCCADSLRFQANNCPICRAPFRALLQIKALQKVSGLSASTASNSESGDIPAGYEPVSLIEALNGPSVTPQQPSAPPFQDMYVQLPQNNSDGDSDTHITKHFEEETGDSGVMISQSNDADLSGTSAVEMKACTSDEHSVCLDDVKTTSKVGSAAKNKKGSREKLPHSSRDSVKIINEMKPADPSEVRSLLKEDIPKEEEKQEEVSVDLHNAKVLALMSPLGKVPSSALEEEECDSSLKPSCSEEKEEETRDECCSSEAPGSSKMDRTCRTSVGECTTSVKKSPHRRVRLEGRSNAQPSGRGFSAAGAVTFEPQSCTPIESLSLPGTPLSNASAVSRTSDVSVSSSSSTKALLSYLNENSSGSIV